MSSRPPLVSAVVTVFNGEQYVADAVHSLLQQDGVEFEVVVVDDGSTDGTAAVLDSIDDPRLRVVHRPHEGRVAALNTALQTARGRYVANLDADDLALPDRLRRSAEHLERHPDVVAVGSALEPVLGTRTVRKLPQSDRAIRWSFLLRNPMFHSSVMYRAETLRTIGGYDGTYTQRLNDADVLLRLARHGRLVNLPVALSSRRVHADQHFAGTDAALRARLHARCRWRAARELPFTPLARPVALTIAGAGSLRSLLMLRVMGRNGRLDRRHLQPTEVSP